MLSGVVYGSGGGVYDVALEDGRRVEASLRGRLKKQKRTGQRIVAGDRVQVAEAPDGGFTVEAVEPRSTQVIRHGSGRRAKVVAANVDRLVTVVAAVDPEPRPDRIDRFLVMGEADELDGVLVVNKTDLEGAEAVADDLARIYEGAGYRVVRVSAADGTGMDELAEVLCAGSSVLVGPSGVGKSSLLNAIEPSLGLRTGELSRKVRRGRHTTVSARIIPLECGGLVVDTPGFGDAEPWGVDPRELERCFPEFEPYLGHCRFQDCLHDSEPDCAVRAAVEEGEIALQRYESYRALLAEIREQP